MFGFTLYLTVTLNPFQEKQYNIEKEKKSELFQTQWRKPIEKITIPPKQTPVYLVASKGPTKAKKHKTGEKRMISVFKLHDQT